MSVLDVYYQYLLISLYSLLKKHNSFNAKCHKRCSTGTSQTRRETLITILHTLFYVLGFHIRHVSSLGEKHVRALAMHWLRMNLSPGTIRNYFSILRTLFRWLGKDSINLDLSYYYDDPAVYKVPTAARKSKCWIDANVDPIDKIGEVMQFNPIIALQLLLMLIFGLRRAEAIKLQPINADEGNELNLICGTKGGRPRRIPINTHEKRLVLDIAKQYAKRANDSTIPRQYSYKEWLNKFKYAMRKFMITGKDLGVTSHGLRHQYANDTYESLTNMLAPLHRSEGDAVPSREIDRKARYRITDELGHSRLTVTSAYLGSSRKVNTLRAIDEKVEQNKKDED